MLLRGLFRDLGVKYNVCEQGYPTPDALAEFKMPNPLLYTDHKRFANDYQVYNLARKRELAEPTTSQMRNSLVKWTESEHRCHVVNKHGWWVMPIDAHKRDRLNTIFCRVRTIISDILSDEWPVLDFCPTGGATALTSRKYAFASSKVEGTPLTSETQPHKCAPASRVYLEQMLLENPGVARRFLRARHKLINETVDEPIEMAAYNDPVEIRDLAIHLCSNVPPAKFSFVPKDYETVRLMAMSNSISIMVQKTFGDAMRRALMRVGINLNDQTINQEWAEIGSLTNLIATVDLSAASDSISMHCLTLFPRRWQAYFNASRDTHVAVKATSHKLAMIAGMGNGYIFELETLLFYAITRAVVEECKLDTSMISVYGDDIICPTGAVDLLQEVFLSKGFLLNDQKSFSTGSFRESCGKHYFNGFDVTPWYVKSDLNDLSELYHHYNGLSEWSCRTGITIDSGLEQIGNCIPLKDRCLVPETWSTKSGLHYDIKGLKRPKLVWNKRYQRKEVVWDVYVTKPSIDVCEMLPERLQIINSLISLESADTILSEEIFLKVFVPPNVRLGPIIRTDIGVSLANWYNCARVNRDVRHTARPTIGWNFINRRTKHRGENLWGDA